MTHFKPSRPAMLSALIILSAGLMFLGPDSAGALRAKFHWMLAPFGDAGMAVTAAIKNLTAPPEPTVSQRDAQRFRQENVLLRQQLEAMEAQLLRAIDTAQSGREFSKLFGPRKDVPVEFIAARVVATDSLPYGWSRVLNEGRDQGIEKGMYATQIRVIHDRSKQIAGNPMVISSTAVIGRVIESGAFTSRLAMLTDAAFEMQGQIRRVIDPKSPRMIRYRARIQPLTPGINYPVEVFVTGDGREHMIAVEVKKIHDIRKGDLLQTRPDDGALPAEVNVGVVDRVEDDPRTAGMVKLYIKPLVDMASLRDVMIVIPSLGKLESTEHRGGRR